MENVWNVPIITMYNGGFYPVQELKNRLNDDPGKGKTIGASIPVDSLENVYIYDGYGAVSVGYLDSVFDHPVPAQMRKERDEALQAENLKNENLLKVAREELNLPSWEELGPVRDGGIPLGNSPKVEGDDQITIRSLMVNVDTKTRVVTTELTLHSNKTEDTELIFLLPEVTAGIKRSSLDVKAADGTQVRNVDFKVFLPIEAGKDATLSYTYTTKKVLFDQEEIGVDLSRLASHFNDRIEYFSWNVDLPYYEQILIREVNPDDYTTGDRGISMELKDILMSDYPEGISLVRSTPRTLLDEIRKWEEEAGPDSCYTKEAEFIVDQYPSWLEDPDFRDKIIRDENPDGKDRTAVYTMIHLYLQSHYYKMRSEIFFNAYMEQKDYDDLLEEYAGVGPDENAFYTSQESCANFEALLLGDSDHQNEHSQKVRSNLNKIMTALMEQADPETSSDETETVGTDIDGTEADSTKTPAFPTGSPSEDPAPAEKSHLPIIFIIAGFGGILAIIALRVIRKVKR